MLQPQDAAVACDVEGIARAAAALRAGNLVGLPTETVYGLAADARNLDAVARIFEVKGRPADHPLIVHLADASAIDDWARDIPDYARRLGARLWPGPLTLVLPARDETPRLLTGGQDTVGLRVPAHAAAHAVIASVDAVAAPSANRFGRVSPTRAVDVVSELGDALRPGDLVLDGGECSIGIESTIVDCTGPQPRVLRPGFYSDDVVQHTAAAASSAPAVDDLPARTGAAHTAASIVEGLGAQTGAAATAQAESSSAPRVSGSLPGHYAPSTPVHIVDPDACADMSSDRLATALVLTLSMNPPPSLPAHLVQAVDSVDYARKLYAALRLADDLGVAEVIAVAPPVEGIGAAIVDRLTRAAHGSNNAGL